MKVYGPLVESHCPTCDYTLTAATGVHGEDGPPAEGDATLCLNCAQLLTYQADLTLRKMTADEVRALMTENPEAWATIEKSQRIFQRRGRFA